MKCLTRSSLRPPLASPQDKAIPHPAFEVLEFFSPRLWNGAGFYIDSAHVPAQCFAENIVRIPTVPKPRLRHTTGLHRNRCRSPHILNACLRNLFGILIEHLWLMFLHVTETVEAPARPMGSSIHQGFRLIKVHQELSLMKRFEVDIDQFFLNPEFGHVATPSFA